MSERYPEQSPRPKTAHRTLSEGTSELHNVWSGTVTETMRSVTDSVETNPFDRADDLSRAIEPDECISLADFATQQGFDEADVEDAIFDRNPTMYKQTNPDGEYTYFLSSRAQRNLKAWLER